MAKANQFVLLLWKNWLLQKRKVFVTVLEIGLPAFFAVILIFIRMRVEAVEIKEPTTWKPFSVDKFPPTLCPSSNGFSPYEDQEGCKWSLYYSPNTTLTDRIMSRLVQSNIISGAIGFAQENEMTDKFVRDLEKCSNKSAALKCDVLAAIVFSNGSFSSDAETETIQYKIRLPSQERTTMPFGLNSELDWKTRFMFPVFQLIGPRSNRSQQGGDPKYYEQGFLTLQLHIDRSIVTEWTNDTSQNDYGLELRRTPYPPYNNDNFVLVLQNQFPFILLLSFIFSALNIVKEVVYEKERKLKESMKMMGLSNWLHWTAWFVKYFLFLLVSIIMMTVFFTIPVGKYGSVIGKTSPIVLLVFLLAYGISVICFSFMISVFFSKANSAAAAGGIIFFLSYIPFFFLQPRYDTLSWGAKIGACLISNVAMAFGGQVIGMFEGTGAGVQWTNIYEGASVDDNFSLLNVIVMLLLDSILYLVVTWYVEAVKPGEYGIPQPWYFPVLKSYWCGVLPKEDFDDGDSETAPLLISRSSGESSTQSSGFFEGDPIGLKPGIRIRNLKKEFGSGPTKNVAVNDMSLNMYEGQITALLGHNGAGKTTTMSMLTGFIPPTAGTAYVNGYNIREDIASVRSSLGLCPQHDVLFDALTVNEHLVFFAKLKGCRGNDVKREVDNMLDAVGLVQKRDALTKTLSGGQKRKLSVGIALVGGSKIVMLDEPTSGMDPNARRQTWDILQRHREGRTMILTTHFMDEADILGDRIAIMAKGELQCCGTSLFLKNKYGAGYHMVMVKDTGCDVQKITQLVQNYVPDAKMESNISAELSYILPHESKENFEPLFTEIESRKAELRVSSYGASVTTMEEVFLRVGEESDEAMKGKLNKDVGGTFTHDNRNSSFNSAPLFNRDIEKNTGPALYVQQFLGMLLKRALHTWRNWLVTISQLAVPLFFTIIALIVIKTLPGPEDSPPLTLDLTHFRENTIVYSSGLDESSTSLSTDLAKAYASQFQNKSWTLEYLNNVSSLSLEDYLIKMGEGRIATYTENYIIAAEFEDKSKGNDTEVTATAYFNAQTYHAQAISLNAMDNALLRHAARGRNLSISTVNHPLPRTIEEQVNDQLTKGFEGFTIAINLLFGMSFLASSFVLFLIRERSLKAKHSQFVSGVHSFTFWSSTFVWDFINYLLPCFLLIVSFASFNITAYVGDGRFLQILLLFVLYGWAILPFMYNLSFIFSVPSTGLVWLTMFNILSGIATVLAVQILKIPQLNTMEIGRVLEWIFLVLLPNFCMGEAMLEFYNNYQFLQICNMPEIRFLCDVLHIESGCCKGNCGDECLDYQDNYLAWEAGGIGRMLVFMAVQGFLYFGILFLLESHFFQKIFYGLRPSEKSRYQTSEAENLVEEDADVAVERQRIANTPIETLFWTDSLVIRELKKYYGNLLAVDRISVGIPQGECFGLLGINGAGKTSTFKMLTGDEVVSGGNAYLEGHDIKHDIKMVQRHLGYCPQFDALIDELTGRETLYMYARLRGVKEALIPTVVSDLISALLLDEHADKLVKSFSGGNKRKLSAAIALVGDPPIVFLDEPTTGMDPVARRLLWDTLSQVRASGRTLVLTSHSMEECEALCTRIAIMVNGQFKCLGSQQHLKNKFGEGFTVIAKIGYPEGGGEPNVEPLMEYITTTFPGSVLKDVHQGMVHYHVTDTSTSWSRLFGAMEKGKARFGIEDYLVSQTTLEQVFINFARSQIPPQETRAGLCAQCCTLMAFCLCSRCCHSCRSGYELAPVGDTSTNLTVSVST